MGSGGKAQTVGYRYYGAFHGGLGLGMDRLTMIKVGDVIAWEGVVDTDSTIRINAPTLFGGDKGEGGIEGTLDVMFGKPDQPVNSRLAEMLGGIVPAFRGFVGVFFDGLLCSMNPYPKPWAFRRDRALNDWDGAVWYPEKCVIWLADNKIRAMNPAHILYETYTNRTWAAGVDRNRMDDAAWRAAADTLFDEGFGLCIEWRTTDSLSGFRDQILNHIDAVTYVNRRTGKITLKLLRDDYDPVALPLFDENSGLLEITEDNNSVTTVSPTEVIVTYTDAITGDDRQARAVNLALAAQQTGRAAESVSYPGIPTGELGARVAGRDLKKKDSGLKRYKVPLGREAYMLNIGDVFKISSARRGIGEVILRALRIEEGPISDNKITITAVQDIFGLPSTAFIPVPDNEWQPPDNTPKLIIYHRVDELPYRELAAILSAADIDYLTLSASYLMTLGVKPTGLSHSYSIATRTDPTAAFVIDDSAGGAAFCPTAELLNELNESQTQIEVTNLIDSYAVEVGTAALIDDEIVRIDAVDWTTNKITIGRGCLDTVPAGHAATARIWFYDTFEGTDNREYSAGLEMQVKLLTNTAVGQLAPDQAGTDSITFHGRQGLPYPPGQFVFSVQYADDKTTVNVSWAHRDRLLQADQIIDTTLGDIGPEPDTTYTVRLISDATGTVVIEQAGIDGTSTSLETDYSGDMWLELFSVRDGYVSWQRHRRFVLGAVSGAARITENGDYRITESGDLRITE